MHHVAGVQGPIGVKNIVLYYAFLRVLSHLEHLININSMELVLRSSPIKVTSVDSRLYLCDLSCFSISFFCTFLVGEPKLNI